MFKYNYFVFFDLIYIFLLRNIALYLIIPECFDKNNWKYPVKIISRYCILISINTKMFIKTDYDVIIGKYWFYFIYLFSGIKIHI